MNMKSILSLCFLFNNLADLMPEVVERLKGRIRQILEPEDRND